MGGGWGKWDKSYPHIFFFEVKEDLKGLILSVNFGMAMKRDRHIMG